MPETTDGNARSLSVQSEAHTRDHWSSTRCRKSLRFSEGIYTSVRIETGEPFLNCPSYLVRLAFGAIHYHPIETTRCDIPGGVVANEALHGRYLSFELAAMARLTNDRLSSGDAAPAETKNEMSMSKSLSIWGYFRQYYEFFFEI